MTGEEGTEHTAGSYYIPPTAGPGTKDLKKPEKTTGEDWTGLALVVFGMMILFAGFQLFMIIMQLINTWIADQLVPFFIAAFDILVIAAAIWLIRKYSLKK